jgi:SAM-dependent methyltransferase
MTAEPENVVDRDRFAAGRGYVTDRGDTPFEEFEASFDRILNAVGRYHPITPETKIFEVGAGLGWFEVIAAMRGLSCSAIELSPLNLEAAHDLARQHGVKVDIELGNIENFDLGREAYDVVIATSVFEHVRHYGRGLAKIYDSLRPGGVFFFYSTNRFSFRSGEYPDFPFYGWYPYSVRERIRVSRSGRKIVDSAGMDFNQFTYRQLYEHFKSLGYSEVLDRVDYLDPGDESARGPVKTGALRLVKSVPPLKFLARTFDSGTAFVCVK